jgi:hypothetical protein
MAQIPAEPLAPKGVNAKTLATWLQTTFGQSGVDFFQWMSVNHPGWGRSLANRAEAVQTACKTGEGTP